MMMTCSQAVGEAEGVSVGATRVYVCPARDQLFLLPVCMRDWLEEGHLAWFVLDVVAELDTGGLHRRPGGCPGRPPYEPEMLGWIQLVAATPDVEELLCRGETGRGIVPLQPERVGVVIRLLGDGSIGSGTGRRSLEVRQARRLRSRRVCCRVLVSGGSARVEGCRLFILRRCRGGICRSPSGRRSRVSSRVAAGSGRSRVNWVAHHRRSPGSCSETLRCGPASLSIEPRPPRDTLSVALNVPAGEARGECAAAGLCPGSAFWHGAAA